MKFNPPRRDSFTSSVALPPPMRAEGNLRYLDFIRLVQKLWQDSHPDIPIKPVQSRTFVCYPVMTYALQLRKTHSAEPKPKIREEVLDDAGQLYVITGQRFENVIVFTVITQNDPTLAEAIIEKFEDFMLEYTPVFKRLGVSEFVYSRRLPDSEETRKNDDIETRAVAYMMTEERLRHMKVDRLQEIIVNARIFLRQDQTNFTTTTNTTGLFLDGDIDQFPVGQPVIVYADKTNPASLPSGLGDGFIYIVNLVEGNNVYLADLSGNPIDPRGAGSGCISPDNLVPLVGSNIEDLYAGATPTTN